MSEIGVVSRVGGISFEVIVGRGVTLDAVLDALMASAAAARRSADGRKICG